MPRLLKLLVLAAAVALIASACTSNGDDMGIGEVITDTSEGGDDTTGTTNPDENPDDTMVTVDMGDDGDETGDGNEPEPDGPPTPGPEGSARFVAAAINDEDARSILATSPFDDIDRGAPFVPDVLGARLVELKAFSGSVETARPADNAFPASPDGPACDRTADLYCQVDLFGADDSLLGSVIVYWFGDGVTGFTIVNRSPAGDPIGIGLARCSNGYQVLHGGHTPDRFDIAVCVDGAGQLEYNGAVRGENQGIKLAGCAAGPTWVAFNEQHEYRVEAVSASRSYITVFAPDGEVLVDEPLTSITFQLGASPAPC